MDEKEYLKFLVKELSFKELFEMGLKILDSYDALNKEQRQENLQLIVDELYERRLEYKFNKEYHNYDKTKTIQITLKEEGSKINDHPFRLGGLVQISIWDDEHNYWRVLHMQNSNNKECFDILKKYEGKYKMIKDKMMR